MKMHRRLILTYLDKYHRLDMRILTEEMRMTETQITDIIYEFSQNGLISVQDHKYILNEEAKKYIFPIWNEWCFCNKNDRYIVEKEFVWDYLYIPENMI